MEAAVTVASAMSLTVEGRPSAADCLARSSRRSAVSAAEAACDLHRREWAPAATTRSSVPRSRVCSLYRDQAVGRREEGLSW